MFLVRFSTHLIVKHTINMASCNYDVWYWCDEIKHQIKTEKGSSAVYDGHPSIQVSIRLSSRMPAADNAVGYIYQQWWFLSFKSFPILYFSWCSSPLILSKSIFKYMYVCMSVIYWFINIEYFKREIHATLISMVWIKEHLWGDQIRPRMIKSNKTRRSLW